VSWTIASLAAELGLETAGSGARDCVLERASTLDGAGPNDLAFVARKQYQDQLARTRAGCVIVAADRAATVPSVALVADEPHLAFARAAQLLHPDVTAAGRMSATAVVAPGAEVAPDVDLGAGVTVADGASIARGVCLEAGVHVGADSVVGADCRIGANVFIGAGSRLGERVRIQPGAVIGGEGFGYIWHDTGWVRVPQLGRVIIGDDVQVGANTTIDRGALEDTVIENGVLLDNLIQVAHNVRIGEYTAIAGCTGIAGSTVIGRRCTIGGAVGIVGHLVIGDDVHITGQARVTHSLPKPGIYSSGTPLEEHGTWRRNAARFRQLDALARRLRRLGG